MVDITDHLIKMELNCIELKCACNALHGLWEGMANGSSDASSYTDGLYAVVTLLECQAEALSAETETLSTMIHKQKGK